ncbi:MAG: ribonuclease III [Pseudomonadota bacterium]|jgi:ribonuclease-3|nr:MAG: ribonuclease III [Pseudomonadota bacterium]
MNAPAPARAGDEAIAAWVCGLLGREVRQIDLYRSALTHRSARQDNNERLEFLGDAVLGMVIAEELFRRFAAADEGDLSRLRARLVSSAPLAQIGAQIGIGAMLHLGSGELRSGGFRRESILADATEALFGAMYLEGGLDEVRGLILRLYAPQLESLRPEGLKDAKTRLQELLQGRGEALPAYVLESTVGEPHEQVFTVRCEAHLSGREQPLAAQGTGSSRRRAEQQAAGKLLDQLAELWGR